MTGEEELKVWREWFAKAAGGYWEGVEDIEAELGRRESRPPANEPPSDDDVPHDQDGDVGW